jgi:ApbE superfamily uncharacterized protein (UPF0280 family)
MRQAPQSATLSDGSLHLQHGPIDLILQADGDPQGRRHAFRAAQTRFQTILDELCDELPVLRAPASLHTPPQSPVGRRMHAAVIPHAPYFITPMAAVAGAVADEILTTMCAAATLQRASVNNGGDIALHLAGDACWRIGLVDRPDRPGLFGTVTLRAGDGIGGVATSGWRGRSFSLGIADAVTILAQNAAAADAAGTMVANAVDLPDHPGIQRVRATDIQPDSDLGDRRVTRNVPRLSPEEIARALSRGADRARFLAARGLIAAAALHCQGHTDVVGWDRIAPPGNRTP